MESQTNPKSSTAKISVIIPVYNESPSLPELCARIDKTLITYNEPYEIILIDDGSTDDSFATMEKLYAERTNMSIIRHRVNMGKTMALMTGFRHAVGEIVVTLDADLQDHPEAMPDLLKKMEEGYDFVGGWRHKRQDSIMKHFISHTYNFITKQILKVEIHDINCGYKAIRREYYSRFKLTGDMHRIIPAIVKAMGGRITEVPVPHSPRKYGSSCYNLLRYRGILDIIAFIGSHSTRWRPFHVFTELAFAFWFVTFLLVGMWTIFNITCSSQFLSLVTPICLVGATIFGLAGILLPVIGLQTEIFLQLVQKPDFNDQFIEQRNIRRS